ncbi:hypothetical protein GCM10010280_16580 [Streptomyces pilosus]|uniref:Uncharacterized protein n=1 Tax=Streptomyces pilosus TaxID=28893 RepID=A0A918ETU8_9ACTN|nr:hypothetical protein GCM10010280_16580 [Streptomyces pilosus]
MAGSHKVDSESAGDRCEMSVDERPPRGAATTMPRPRQPPSCTRHGRRRATAVAVTGPDRAWFGAVTMSSGLPAACETATPPAVRAPLPVTGERIGEGAFDVQSVQARHLTSQLGSRSERQLPQDFRKHVAGMSHIVEGTAAARALRVLRVQGTTSRRA